MKDKILALLKTTYASLGFTEKEFDASATYLATLVKADAADSELQPLVTGAEPMLKAFIGYTDNRVNSAVDKYKADNPKGPNPPEPEKKDPPAGETPTEKMFREFNELLTKQNDLLNKQSERIALIEGGETTKTRAEQLNALIEKANPAYKKTVLEMFDFVKDADETKFQSFMDKTKTGMDAFSQSLTEQGLTNINAPQVAGVVAAAGSDNGGNTFVDGMKAYRESVEAQRAKKVDATPAV